MFPVALSRLHPGMVADVPVYLRGRGGRLVLYRAAHLRFRSADRDQLIGHGHEFVYIPLEHQDQIRSQLEAALRVVAVDRSMRPVDRAAIIYDAGLALLDEVFAGLPLGTERGRIENVTRATVLFAMDDPTVSAQLLHCAQHDLCISCQAVNVGTAMVVLAGSLGERDEEQLGEICVAGMLRDIGYTKLPGSLTSSKGPLSEIDGGLVRRHPDLGYEYLRRCAGLPELAATIARQHHERLDGSGYPQGLRGDDIHPVSRMCAVVETYYALTSYRPYRSGSHTPAEAIQLLQGQCPSRLDAEIVSAWGRLVLDSGSADPAPVLALPESDRRSAARSPIQTPGWLSTADEGGQPDDGVGSLAVVTQNLSRRGLGCLAREAIPLGTRVRIVLNVPGWREKTLEGLVVRCQPCDDGWHDVGVALTGVLVQET